MIYGYPRKVLDERGLTELREISLVMDPRRLRLIAQFLIEKADEMEVSAKSGSWHRHLSSWIPAWEMSGDADVIVAATRDDPRSPD